MSELMIQDKEPVKVVLLGLDLGQFDRCYVNPNP